MKICVIGAGYVGLVSSACFAEMGNEVICVDTNKDKVTSLKNGIVPIYELGLESMIIENYKKKTLDFTIDIKKTLSHYNICILAVETPMNKDGGANLDSVNTVAKSIGLNMIQQMYIIIKSTVPVGTAGKIKDIIQNELDIRNSDLTFEVISNPEFLKEGDGIEDFMKPDRIIIGADNQQSFDMMKELYAPFTRNHDKFILMDNKSAEMTKYTSNAMLATKISFMNEIANICEKVGADVNFVRKGVGSDSRIGNSFIYPGCGYGGSCFPKDIRALVKTSKDNGYTPKILEAVDVVNNQQKKVIIKKIIERFGQKLENKIFAIWGLSFKPGTDDMREATSIVVIKELVKRGAKIKAYDPKSIHNAKSNYLKNINIEYVEESKYDALLGADALILLTEWKEFRSPDFHEISKRLKNSIIFDGRNQYDKVKLKSMNFEYIQIGVEL